MELINVENLVSEAKKHGVNFGKGDPYNRLRYYTKMGWLPHMIRKRGEDNTSVKGHYPKSALNLVLVIEKYKKAGMSNEDITKNIQSTDKMQNVRNLLATPEIKKQLGTIAVVSLLVLIFANELGIITLGKTRSALFAQSAINLPKEILDSGDGTVSPNQKSVFIDSSIVTESSKVYVTFNTDISPAMRFWVANKRPGQGFTLELDAPVYAPTYFSWWISN
ncbi:MAG TPA: hypothetical protein VLI92_03200 [Candidatus Saccharimonadales bacterium]|nr:hypothetical protein [Candidatus Saccharimonadales bacterium]